MRTGTPRTAPVTTLGQKASLIRLLGFRGNLSTEYEAEQLCMLSYIVDDGRWVL